MTTPAVALAPAPSSTVVVAETPTAAYALTTRVRTAFASMRAGAADIGRSTIDFLRLGGVADGIRKGWGWIGDHFPWVRGLVEVMGTGATTVAALTSESGQAVIGWVGKQIGRGLRWVARTAYGVVDWTLRLFGRTGNNAADWMFDRTVEMQNWVTEAAAPQFHRVVRSTSFDQPNVRAVHKVSLGLIAFRLITAFITPLPLKILAGIGAGLLIAGKEGRETGKLRMDQAAAAHKNPLVTAREKIQRVKDLDERIQHSVALREETLRYLTDPELNAMKDREDLQFALADAVKAREAQAAKEDKGVADVLSTDTPETSPRPVRILSDQPPS